MLKVGELKHTIQRAIRLVNTWRLGRLVLLERSGKLHAFPPYFVLCMSSIWPFLSYILVE